MAANGAFIGFGGLLWPEASASPRPIVASMRMRSSEPVSGSTVKAIPAASAGTSRCTTTAMRPGAAGSPCCAR